jgi:hypothetical protein
MLTIRRLILDGTVLCCSYERNNYHSRTWADHDDLVTSLFCQACACLHLVSYLPCLLPSYLPTLT